MKLIKQLNWVSDDVLLEQDGYLYLCSSHTKRLVKALVLEPMPDGISTVRYADRVTLLDPELVEVEFDQVSSVYKMTRNRFKPGRDPRECILFVKYMVRKQNRIKC